MKKQLSFFSLSFLITPAYFYAMEPTDSSLSTSQILSTRSRFNTAGANAQQKRDEEELFGKADARLNASAPHLTVPIVSKQKAAYYPPQVVTHTHEPTITEQYPIVYAQTGTHTQEPALSVSQPSQHHTQERQSRASEQSKQLWSNIAQKVQSKTPPFHTPSTSVTLSRSTLAARKQAVLQTATAAEAKPWRITGLVNSFRDATAVALAEVTYLEGKPQNVTAVSHKLEWGINDTLDKINTIRTSNTPQLIKVPELKSNATQQEKDAAHAIQEENRRKLADSFLTILREQQPHTKNLKTIIEGAFINSVNLNEDVLAKAHSHLELAKSEALEYQKHALKESQQYLQDDKSLRCDIYEIKLLKDNLLCPSDDEYDDISICNHYLHDGDQLIDLSK